MATVTILILVLVLSLSINIIQLMANMALQKECAGWRSIYMENKLDDALKETFKDMPIEVKVTSKGAVMRSSYGKKQLKQIKL